jgi:glycosyltransferase involved in cell wall biosynthesis
MHDTTPELYQSKFNLPSNHVLIRVLRWIERISARCAHHVITVHPPHQNLLASRGIPKKHTSVVLNTPDPSVFQRGCAGVYSAHAPVFVYHGTVARRLGVDLLVEAFAQVLQQLPEARLRVLGTGDDASYVQQRIAQLGVGHAVFFPNTHVRLEKLVPLLQDTSVGVVSNRPDPSTQWMLPVKLLEYMQLGIPCVVPSLPVIVQTVGEDAGWYYPPGNVQALAHNMLESVQSKDAWQARREKALQWSDKNGWALQRQTLLDVINGTVGVHKK